MGRIGAAIWRNGGIFQKKAEKVKGVCVSAASANLESAKAAQK